MVKEGNMTMKGQIANDSMGTILAKKGNMTIKGQMDNCGMDTIWQRKEI